MSTLPKLDTRQRTKSLAAAPVKAAKIVAGTALLALSLSACTTMSKVIPGAEGLWGGKENAGAKDQDFPDLADTPSQPDAAAVKKDKDRVAEGLVGDLERANHTREQITATQATGSPVATGSVLADQGSDLDDFVPAAPTAQTGDMPTGGYEAGDPSHDPEAAATPPATPVE